MSRPPRTLKTAQRRAAWRRGHWAELECLWLLRLKGYRIIARRYRVPVGEVDLIARRGSVLAAIEVKARSAVSDAMESIQPRQQRRVTRALQQFLGTRPDLARLQPRFDVMLVAPWRWPVHVANAWEAER